MSRGVIILAAALVVSGGALAQSTAPPPAPTAAPAATPELNPSAQAMIGVVWAFSNADRSKVCNLSFGGVPAKVGYQLAFDVNCANVFPVVANIVGWRYPENDLLYLLDATGKALVEFSEVEDGMFEAPTPGVGVLFLHNPATDQPDNSDKPESGESPQGGEGPQGAEPPQGGEPAAPQEAPASKDDGG